MKSLFDKTNIGSLALENRVFRAACGDSHGVAGHITDADIDLYRALSAGGIGALITGYTYIGDYGMAEDIGMFDIYDDSFIPEYKRLTDAVHSAGAKIVMQLVHLGSATLMKGVCPLAPSAVENPMTHTIPREMTADDMSRIEGDFARAAVRAQQAGFDGVELHGAHNFLINQFTSPHYNHRTDGYGGIAENRARFAVETVRLVRDAVGADFPVLVKMQSAETFSDGITEADFLTICKLVADAGASAIEVSGAWMTYRQKEPYFEPVAARLAQSVSIPVILTGGIRSRAVAERVLNDTQIQYIGMCRPFINNPNLLNEWRNGAGGESKCVSCGGCSRTHRCVLNTARK